MSLRIEVSHQVPRSISSSRSTTSAIGRGGVDAHVRLGVRQLPARIELFHLRAIGGQRPAAVGGHALDDAGQRHVEPRHGAVGQHQRAVVRLRRTCRRRSRRSICRSASSSLSTCRSSWRKYASPCCAKIAATDRRSRASIRSSMSSTRQPSRRPSARATVRLAGAHEADQIQLVRLHARSDSSTEKNSGIRHRRGAGVVDRRGPEAPSAAMANAMARR